MAQAAARMAKFHYKMAKSLLLSQYRANQVALPEVKSMTVNLMTGAADGHAGLRHFNRTLLPSFRLANPELECFTKSRVYDKSITKPTIDVTFKDGTTTSYEAFGKDQVEIYNDITKLAKGKYWLKAQNRKLPPPKLGEAELFAAE